MPFIIVLLLFSLLSNHFVGLYTGSNIWETGLVSPDKLLKVFVIGLAGAALALRRRGMRIPDDLWKNLIPCLFIIGLMLVHIVFSSGADDLDAFRARKEIVRFATIVFVFFLIAVIFDRRSSFRALLLFGAIAGLALSVLAIRNSLTSESQAHWMRVGEFMRAGTGITDSNTIGAALNFFSVLSLGGFFVERAGVRRAFFALVFLVIQVARFSTFSTGATLSFVVMIGAMLVLLRKYERPVFGPLLKFSIVVVLCMTILVAKSGLYTTVFSRLTFSSEKVKQESVHSRLAQYEGYVNLVKDDPAILVSGLGLGNLPEALGEGQELHNTYIRPLATGGILAFVCFMFVWVFAIRNAFSAIAMSGQDRDYRIVSIFFTAAFIGWSLQAATLPSDTSTEHWTYIILAYLLARYGKLAAMGHEVAEEGCRPGFVGASPAGNYVR